MDDTGYGARNGEEESAKEEVAQPEVQVRVEVETGKTFAGPGTGADAAAQGAILSHDVGAKHRHWDEEPQRFMAAAGDEAASKVEPDEFPLDVSHLEAHALSEWHQ